MNIFRGGINEYRIFSWMMSGSAHSDIANLREKLYSAQSELVRLGYN